MPQPTLVLFLAGAADQCREESRNAETDWRDGEEAKRNPNYSARKIEWAGHFLFQCITTNAYWNKFKQYENVEGKSPASAHSVFGSFCY